MNSDDGAQVPRKKLKKEEGSQNKESKKKEDRPGGGAAQIRLTPNTTEQIQKKDQRSKREEGKRGGGEGSKKKKAAIGRVKETKRVRGGENARGRKKASQRGGGTVLRGRGRKMWQENETDKRGFWQKKKVKQKNAEGKKTSSGSLGGGGKQYDPQVPISLRKKYRSWNKVA